ncbi:MAG: NYN domain-containing protein [Anaerolineae bacterium]|nr:NYN domain-containing protein [Anaerolineae bacterium]
MPKSLYIFVDDSNLVGLCRQKNKNLDWIKLRDFLADKSDGDLLKEMIIYVGMPPLIGALTEKREGKERYAHWLRSQGFLVFTHNGSPTPPDTYTANVDILMALSCFEISTRNQPDVVVLVTGDGDFAPLPIFLRNYGISTEIATIEDAMGTSLKDSANRIIDLEPFIDSLDDLK